MTRHLLDSSLKEKYHLIHFNISKGRGVSTKARFDWINVTYGLLQPLHLFFLLLRHRPNVVYTNMAQNLGGFLRYASFVLVCATCGTPVVVRVMGDGFNQFYARSNPLVRWLIRRVLGSIRYFIVRAEALKKQFAALVPPENLCVIHSGIDTAAFNRSSNKFSDGPLYVLFVGYLTKAKGALDLLQAIPQIVADHPNVVFQLMGERVDIERNITYVSNPASNEQALDQLLARPDVHGHVQLLGVQSGEQKIESFVNADIFVLPSYSEAFPTVVLEAMAAGLPVIATPVGVLPEAFTEQNILFVQPGNVSELAGAITRLVDDTELRNRMGEQNRSVAQTRFNLEAYATRVDELFQKLLQKNVNVCSENLKSKDTDFA